MQIQGGEAELPAPFETQKIIKEKVWVHFGLIFQNSGSTSVMLFNKFIVLSHRIWTNMAVSQERNLFIIILSTGSNTNCFPMEHLTLSSNLQSSSFRHQSVKKSCLSTDSTISIFEFLLKVIDLLFWFIWIMPLQTMVSFSTFFLQSGMSHKGHSSLSLDLIENNQNFKKIFY